jgi:hypothetical protein
MEAISPHIHGTSMISACLKRSHVRMAENDAFQCVVTYSFRREVDCQLIILPRFGKCNKQIL